VPQVSRPRSACWADNLVGAASTGPVISFLPIILIAVLFGLAMDYEVFMASRIREAYLETNDPSGAVIHGGRQATRIVNAAALIMLSSRQPPCRTPLIRCRPYAAATAATDIPIWAAGSTCTTGG
jgi:putative drug exporter of the RND superfamily